MTQVARPHHTTLDNNASHAPVTTLLIPGKHGFVATADEEFTVSSTAIFEEQDPRDFSPQRPVGTLYKWLVQPESYRSHSESSYYWLRLHFWTVPQYAIPTYISPCLDSLPD